MGIEAQARRLHSANAGQIKSVNACSLATVPSCVGGKRVSAACISLVRFLH